MTTSKNLSAYEDISEIMERALAAEKGISISTETQGEAVQLLQRCNSYRAVFRNNQRALYGPDDPRGQSTPYDTLKISRKDLTVRLQKRTAITYNIEEIQ